VSHTPYGYTIESGRAVIVEESAKQVKVLFQAYLSGLSLAAAAKKAGINRCHASIALMLRNRRYIGNEFYPQIIKEEEFNQAESERLKRAQSLGRIHQKSIQEEPGLQFQFNAPLPKQSFDNPFKQAEYAYSLIESEVKINDK